MLRLLQPSVRQQSFNWGQTYTKLLFWKHMGLQLGKSNVLQGNYFEDRCLCKSKGKKLKLQQNKSKFEQPIQIEIYFVKQNQQQSVYKSNFLQLLLKNLKQVCACNNR